MKIILVQGWGFGVCLVGAGIIRALNYYFLYNMDLNSAKTTKIFNLGDE
jgi:hypothetical protein